MDPGIVGDCSVSEISSARSFFGSVDTVYYVLIGAEQSPCAGVPFTVVFTEIGTKEINFYYHYYFEAD